MDITTDITMDDIHIMNCRTTERILTVIADNMNAFKAKENSVYLTDIVYYSDCDHCAKQIFNKTLNNICDEFLKQNVVLTIKWDPAIYCELEFGSSYKSKIMDFTWRID